MAKSATQSHIWDYRRRHIGGRQRGRSTDGVLQPSSVRLALGGYAMRGWQVGRVKISRVIVSAMTRLLA